MAVRALFLAGSMLAAFAAPVAAQDVNDAQGAATSEAQDSRLALAKTIIDISFPEETRMEMFQKVTDQMEAQMMQSLTGMITDEGALAIIGDWQERISVETDAIMRRHIPDLMKAWAAAYAGTYSEPELRDILAFVSTPSGKAFMIRSQDLLSHPAFAGANQEFMDETMGVVMGKMPDMMQDLVTYRQSQSESSE